jgi:hypothetical protein
MTRTTDKRDRDQVVGHRLLSGKMENVRHHRRRRRGSFGARTLPPWGPRAAVTNGTADRHIRAYRPIRFAIGASYGGALATPGGVTLAVDLRHSSNSEIFKQKTRADISAFKILGMLALCW